MIKSQVLFLNFTVDYDNLGAYDKDAINLMDQWIDQASNNNLKAPIIQLYGIDMITENDYTQCKNIFNSIPQPFPIIFLFSNETGMCIEDARGMPDTLQQAINMLQYFNLIYQSRLPI